MSLAVVLGFMAVLSLFAIIAAFLPRPSRECPRCGRPVALTASRCRNCTYRFTA